GSLNRGILRSAQDDGGKRKGRFRGPSIKSIPRECLPGFLVERDRLASVVDHLARDHALADLVLRRDRVHDLEHELFDDDLQSARADVALERFFGDRFERVVREAELDVFEAHDGLVLAHERILRLAEDLDERTLVELAQRRHYGQTANELRNQAELDQILGVNLREELAGPLVFLRRDLRAEAHRGRRKPALDHILQPDERAAELLSQV